jgi:hypothetical protein
MGNVVVHGQQVHVFAVQVANGHGNVHALLAVLAKVV